MTNDPAYVSATATQSFPPEIKVPNEETRAALEEAREIREMRKTRFETPDALFADLNGPVNLARDRN